MIAIQLSFNYWVFEHGLVILVFVELGDLLFEEHFNFTRLRILASTNSFGSLYYEKNKY